MDAVALHEHDEQLFFTPSHFLVQFYEDLKRATQSLEIEMYIWAVDPLTDEIEKRILAASSRGVKVRIIVDGFGSYEWVQKRKPKLQNQGIEIKVFHPMPGFNFLLRFAPQIFKIFHFFNHRDHRKIMIIDKQLAYVGSFNFMQQSLEWRETIVRLTNLSVQNIQTQFESTWLKPKIKFDALLKRPYQLWPFQSANRVFRREFISLLNQAQKRIWLTTPYFNPPRDLLKALVRAAHRGVDVCLLLPLDIDSSFLRWMAQQHYVALLRAQVKIFEYKERILHAKTALIDEQVLVGSANLNFRSFFLDMEANVFLKNNSSVENLKQQFEKDMAASHPIEKHFTLGVLKKIFAYLIAPFKRSI